MRRRGCGRSFLRLFFGLFFLAGRGFLVVYVWAFLLNWRANNRYLPNSCVVLDKKLATGMSDVVVIRDNVHWTVQRPSYQFGAQPGS
jgi:hypothetical protein